MNDGEQGLAHKSKSKTKQNYLAWNTTQVEWKAAQIIILQCHYLQ